MCLSFKSIDALLLPVQIILNAYVFRGKSLLMFKQSTHNSLKPILQEIDEEVWTYQTHFLRSSLNLQNQTIKLKFDSCRSKFDSRQI